MIISYLIKLGNLALRRILLEKILKARFANFGYPAILTCPLGSRVKDMIAKELKQIKLKIIKLFIFS